jgi:integrase
MPKKKASLPRPRRARGSGSGPYPDKRRGGWYGKVPIGRYDDGRTRYTEVRGATQAEVVAKMKAVEPPDPASVTVKEWSARWLAGIDVRPSTRRGYVKQLDARLLPSLGHVKFADLAVSTVRAALVGWSKDGVPTANRTLQVAATMTQAAVIDGILARNPFADCPRLKYTAKELDPFSLAELRQIVANRHTSAADLLAFVAATGVRIGEAAALDVTDYDRITGRASITKTWTTDHGTREPKSKHGRRTITVPAQARPAVERAIDGRTTGVLFRSKSGERFTNSQTFIALGRVCGKLGLRKRGPHQLRHGVLSSLVNSGAPLGDVAKFAGHSVAQLIKTYLHASNADPGAVFEGLLADK